MVVLFVVLFSVVFVVFLLKVLLCVSLLCEKEERKEFALTEKTILAEKKKEKGGNT